MGKLSSQWIKAFILLVFNMSLWAHGVIEKPASREQFCGVETKPHEIYQEKMTHEECRPIMTLSDGSMDNSIYNFMAVLTHTIGRSERPISDLPVNVCGFNSETWHGGKTPWDRAIDWPTVQVKSGPEQFIWNISWGNHFGDTEEFVYWITKPDFKFDPTKELTWNDFESTPFCKLQYNDQSPNANPNVIPDKVNNKFITTCTVPARKNRSVIYAEWGRNKWTYERFHSCIDAVFSDTPPTPTNVKAVIKAIPAELTGAQEIDLDGSQSVGQNLTYTWSVDADDLSPYKLTNSTDAKAHLSLTNLKARQPVTINLFVMQNEVRSQASTQFIHLPSKVSPWQLIGNAAVTETLKAGDKIQLRLIDSNGKDYFLPSEPVLLDADSSKAENIAYTLAQVINAENNFSVKIGVIDSSNNIDPIKGLTNKVYVPTNSIMRNAYIYIVPNSTIETCTVERQSSSSSYWMGYNIYVEKAPFVLDFSSIGIDLDKVNVSGVFTDIEKQSTTKLLIKTKPSWVSKKTPGYMGFHPKSGSYPPFEKPTPASCQATSIK